MRRRAQHVGYTLVELMVCVLLLSLVAGAVGTVLLSSSSASQTGMTFIKVSEDARVGMNRMVEELRHASRDTMTIPDTAQVTFQVPGNANPIQYTLGGTTGTQLIRTQNGVTTVFANNVQSLQFDPSPFTGALITVTLQVQKTSTARHNVANTLTGRAQLRN